MQRKIEDPSQPNPTWVSAKEGEDVGCYMRRDQHGNIEMGRYVIKNGKIVEAP